eukprot:10651070-Karenia_brevis.AAC.1
MVDEHTRQLDHHQWICSQLETKMEQMGKQMEVDASKFASTNSVAYDTGANPTLLKVNTTQAVKPSEVRRVTHELIKENVVDS